MAKMANRLRLLVIVVTTLASEAMAAPCDLPTLVLPPACVGERVTGTARVCFEPQAGCAGSGTVKEIKAPEAPFSLALRFEGAAGSRPLARSDFPLVLLPAESIVVEVSATPTRAGDTDGKLEWNIEGGGDGGHGHGKDKCKMPLAISSPRCSSDPCAIGSGCVAGTCLAGTPVPCPSAGPCAAGRCEAGVGCVQDPLSGPSCDDGDPCTSEDRCEDGECRGRALDCSDGIACTADRCIDGACHHDPQDRRCGGEGCAVGACRPDAPDADAAGCVELVVDDGDMCADDGMACTDDVCTTDGCLHVPIDSRCSTAGECSQALCAPERDDRDADGCVIGPTLACGEDADPCTLDVCRAAACVHELVADVDACKPLTGVFRHALGLAAMTRALATDVMLGSVFAVESAPVHASEHLRRIELALGAAVDALAGRPVGLTPAALPPNIVATPAQQRAQVALTQVLRTPREVRSVVTLLAAVHVRAQLREEARLLRRRGRLLLRGTKTLKGELKRLQRVSQTFAR
jgi:hypothetical protein